MQTRLPLVVLPRLPRRLVVAAVVGGAAPSAEATDNIAPELKASHQDWRVSPDSVAEPQAAYS